MLSFLTLRSRLEVESGWDKSESFFLDTRLLKLELSRVDRGTRESVVVLRPDKIFDELPFICRFCRDVPYLFKMELLFRFVTCGTALLDTELCRDDVLGPEDLDVLLDDAPVLRLLLPELFGAEREFDCLRFDLPDNAGSVATITISAIIKAKSFFNCDFSLNMIMPLSSYLSGEK